MAHNKNKIIRTQKFTKGKDRSILIRGERVSPIKSATGIIADSLYSDKSYQLREQFEFDIDKDNPRSDTGIIISRENIDNWKLEIASARYIFDKDTSERFGDTSFSELLPQRPEVRYGAPIIDQFEYENCRYYLADKNKGGANKLAADLGETHVLSLSANDTLVMVCNAYNFETEKRGKDRETLQFTWYFSADVNRNFDTDTQNKVVGKGRKLILESAQRAQTGRYWCEVSNDKGTTKTVPEYLSVWRPGYIEQLFGGEKNDIPLGKYQWVNRGKDYDVTNPPTGNYKDYIIEEEKWVRMQWNAEANSFERADIARPNSSAGKRPWNSNEKINWIKNNSMKGNTIESNLQRKQGYWKYNDNATVYWSDSQGVYSFPNAPTYYDHREDMGYERDWSDIETYNRTENNPYILENDTITAY